MSGPIVRSGPSEKFSSNWAKAFSEKGKKKTVTKTTTKKKTKTKKKK